MYLFATAGQAKGNVEMVELDELSRKQEYQYVLLHLDDIDEYHRFVGITILDIHISFNIIQN